jgi:hypothetical protein
MNKTVILNIAAVSLLALTALAESLNGRLSSGQISSFCSSQPAGSSITAKLTLADGTETVGSVDCDTAGSSDGSSSGVRVSGSDDGPDHDVNDDYDDDKDERDDHDDDHESDHDSDDHDDDKDDHDSRDGDDD